MKKHRRLNNEILFVLYFWGFTFLLPINQCLPKYSTIILFVFALVILGLSFLLKPKLRKGHIVSYSFIFLLSSIFLLDIGFRSNIYTYKYIYEFIIYGAIPIYLILQCKEFNKLLKYFTICSIFACIIFLYEPFYNYPFFKDYMAFGFNVMLPAYFGIHIGRKYFNIKWLTILEIICLGEIFVFANRSCIISVIFYVFLEQILIEQKTKKTILKYLTILCIVSLIIINFKVIFEYILILMEKWNIDSYSIRQYYNYFESGNVENLFSGRFILWKYASALMMSNTVTIIFGSGTGIFQSVYGIYPHNIILDLLVQYGLLGIIYFLIYITISLINILKSKEKSILQLGLLLYCLWCPKLFFSIYIFKDMAFWSSIIFGIGVVTQYTKQRRENIV